MRHTAKIKKRKPFNTFMLHSKSTYFYKHKWSSPLIPASCCIALLIMIGITINPVISSSREAYAESASPQSDSDLIPEKGVALRIDTTLNDKDTIEEQVTGSGTQYIKVDFTVGANNIQNYDVYVQADSTALTGASHGDKLQSITTSSTGTVGNMQWGYGVSRGDVDPSTMTYKPIQTSAATSADGQDAGEGKTLTDISQPYTLAFAANLEGAASDHYKSNITLSVAAGANEVVTLSSLTYMQDMTPEICTASTENETKRLIDSRDGKYYWVTKLKDDNCWMTQNLALDLTDITLSSLDSDVSTDWTPNLTSDVWSDTNASAIKYYNPGEYVYTTPTMRNSCGTGNIGSLAACTDKGWQNVTGWLSSNDSTFAIIADEINRVYNAHFLAGNYYTYGAAVANTMPSSPGSASGSICPLGWQLPISNGNTVSKSFGYLLTRYGLQSSSINVSDGYDIRTSQLYFVYGGYIDGSRHLNLAGSQGSYWSSVMTNSGYAYSLKFLDSVYPSELAGWYRYYGASVRCVAR